MENLEVVTPDADEKIVTPSQEEETPPQEEDLTPEQISEEVERLKEEAKGAEDPKEKRYIEQQAGRLQQLARAKERADLAELTAREKEDRLQKLEEIEIESAYERSMSTDDGGGLIYFESLTKSDPKLAEKVAQTRFGISAKELIANSKKELANAGDNGAKEEILMEEYEKKAEHKIAVREANKVFNNLEGEEKETAKKYFDKLSGKTLLDIDEALELADMAKHYATRNRKVEPKIEKDEKEKILASTASISLGSPTTPKSAPTEGFYEALVASGVPPYRARLIADAKL